ncbi:MAG: hypothetical protein E7773_09935 [Sphingomonas sp.]|uniref:hypothetical protein n=1 Tax=Sphingomonas sp. TaxID=28214 RepID=UPI0012031709|nr:hypothetical protein [Sphingomonas sp.]THD36225.1 MAG: hypothetical protein E7773_09935 [Sphingomonas sp.]
MRARLSWRGVRLLAAILALAVPSVAARAQLTAPSNLTIVGTFYSDGGTSALFVVTAKPTRADPAKTATVGVEFETLDEQARATTPYTRLMAIFLTADDWRKFVRIWKKARAAGHATEQDYYFDSQTELGVSATRYGAISFTLAGNGVNANGTPKDLWSFDLLPKDIAAFDRDVDQVTAYFAK